MSAVALNMEQLEAELRDCRQIVVVELAARPAFVLQVLIQNAVRRGELRGWDAAALQALCAGMKPMLQDCPHARAAIAAGWEGRPE